MLRAPASVSGAIGRRKSRGTHTKRRGAHTGLKALLKTAVHAGVLSEHNGRCVWSLACAVTSRWDRRACIGTRLCVHARAHARTKAHARTHAHAHTHTHAYIRTCAQAHNRFVGQAGTLLRHTAPSPNASCCIVRYARLQRHTDTHPLTCMIRYARLQRHDAAIEGGLRGTPQRGNISPNG